MLKSIDPILNADVLYALRAMGHGDDLVICDTNFPADAVARQTVLGRLLRIDNAGAMRGPLPDPGQRRRMIEFIESL
jgi:L-fucose mutarotase